VGPDRVRILPAGQRQAEAHPIAFHDRETVWQRRQDRRLFQIAPQQTDDARRYGVRR
jgi:hypothetical protein